VSTAIYARISDDRQDGAGVDRQLEDCRARVDREGWGAAREFVDNSISAFNGKPRPQYLAMLEAARAGEVKRIVAWNIDRLYRQPRELEDLIDLADEGRVSLVTITGDYDLGTENGIMMARLMVSVANQESRGKSRRVKRQKLAARENGSGNTGPRPFGWAALPKRDPKTGRPVVRDGKLVTTWSRDKTDPAEVALIQTAVTDLLGGASLWDIARRWNAAGVPQPQARARKGWVATGIRQVVSSPSLAGLIGHRADRRTWEPAEVVGVGKDWPVIVERSRWEELQGLLEHRAARTHTPRRRSLLTGIVVCDTCEQTMVRSGAGRQDSTVKRKVWRCHRTEGEKRGHSTSIDAAGLEKLLVDATFIRADTASLATIVRQRGRQGEKSRDLVRQLEALERRQGELADSWGAGNLPMSAYEKASASIDREKRALQGKLGPLTSTTPLEPYAGRKGVLEKSWSTLSTDQQRAIIGAALGTVKILPGTRGSTTFDKKRVQIRPRKVEA
jgi:site-specific DNA recombinase